MKTNFSRILYYVWPHVKKHWVTFSLTFLAYAVGVIFADIVKPLIFKEIVDLFSSPLARECYFASSNVFIPADLSSDCPV